MAAMPYYVSPEQMMRDRADYARKGIARGKSIIAIESIDGIVITAENPSAMLHKISELYDKIAFAAVGKYNEFENLRKAGIRIADMTGYAYAREDVNAKAVANAYAQALGAIFTEQMKPFEVEILLAQVGATPEQDEMYRVLYDGSLQDEQGYMAMGGHAEALGAVLKDEYRPELSFAEAIALSAKALEGADPGRQLIAPNLEVAVLDRTRPRRAFRRLADAEVEAILRDRS